MKITATDIKQNLSLLSIIPDEKFPQLVKQKPDSISHHNPDKKWLFKSTELGYFNRVTQFISGDVSSLLFIDVNGKWCSPTITEVSNNQKKYFMVYPIPANNSETINNEVVLNYRTHKFQRVFEGEIQKTLSFDLGIEIGKKFFRFKPDAKEALTQFEEAINGSPNEKTFWPNKNLIINSNLDFVFGILLGYLYESDRIFNPENSNQQFIKDNLFLHKNDNIYIFTTILNWLGASYKFNNITNPLVTSEGYICDKKMSISFPYWYLAKFKEYLKEYPALEIFSKLFKTKEWFLMENSKIRKNFVGKNVFKHNLNQMILDGKLLLVPMTSFKLFDVSKEFKDLILYDFSMERADATNYSLAFTPLLKNSDGDILTMSSIFGAEAIEDAQVFAPTHKEWFRDLNSGAISNYIADDAILGLYAATKNL